MEGFVASWALTCHLTRDPASEATLAAALARFAPATPELLERRKLLRRADTKFLTTPREITAIADGITGDYAVVAVGASNIATYANLYFDTPDLRCFHDHRRGRRLRHKIRIRHYADRELSFLEVKARRNELFTDKARLRVAYQTSALDSAMIAFLRDRCSFADAIVPTVEIDYQRIMLVGMTTDERITIDLGVSVDHNDQLALGAVAIVEVKQPSRSLTTPVMRTLRDAGVKPCSISKYMTALTVTESVRGNRLLPSLRHLERIAHS
ncbi:MAG: polyphosphate polymerase domain-containing protein [Kofleriaceae bacterium]